MRARVQGSAGLAAGAMAGPLTAVVECADAGNTLDRGRRRAALTLHAMQVADRDWLLGQLSLPEQQVLRGLLGELAELGIPLQPRFVADLVKGGDKDESKSVVNEAFRDAVGDESRATRTDETRVRRVGMLASEADNLSEAFRVVNMADPETMVRLLRLEPPLLVARVLALHDWSWREALLDAVGILKRRRIEEFGMSLGPNPPVLANALARQLCDRVRPLQGRGAGHEAVGPVVPQPLPARWRGSLRWFAQARARLRRRALKGMRGRA